MTMAVDRSSVANEPALIRAMRQGVEFTQALQAIAPGADGAAWAQTATARAERDMHRTQQIVRLMVPEIMRMEINQGRLELARRKAAQAHG